METFYGQNRRNYHTFRLSDEEELYVFAKMKELGYHSISAFIRDAIPDGILTVGICLDPVKYDYSHSIRQLITAIPTLEKDGPEQRKSLWTPAQHSRSRFSTHPPPCQQDQTHRRGTRWQVGISDQAAWGVA